MIGIVVVSHAGLADALIEAAELIIGPLEAVAAVCIDRGMDIDAAKNNVQQAVASVGKDGTGVLILTDLFGGTPTNLSAEFLQPGAVEILTGVNLPMLIKGAGARSQHDLDGLTSLLKEYGGHAIMRPADLLR